MSYSFLLLLKKTNWKRTETQKRYCFSSAFRESDSRRSETRTNAFHPFFQQPPPPFFLRRAPRSLGSALTVTEDSPAVMITKIRGRVVSSDVTIVSSAIKKQNYEHHLYNITNFIVLIINNQRSWWFQINSLLIEGLTCAEDVSHVRPCV